MFQQVIKIPGFGRTGGGSLRKNSHDYEIQSKKVQSKVEKTKIIIHCFESPVITYCQKTMKSLMERKGSADLLTKARLSPSVFQVMNRGDYFCEGRGNTDQPF